MCSNPHIWVPSPKPIGALLPRCKYCNRTSIEAQALQPEARGEGPCDIRVQFAEIDRSMAAEWSDELQRRATHA